MFLSHISVSLPLSKTKHNLKKKMNIKQIGRDPDELRLGGGKAENKHTLFPGRNKKEGRGKYAV